MKSTVLVLPFVPVTAIIESGCGPACEAASKASARRGSACSISGRGGTPGGQAVPNGASNRRGTGCHRIGNEFPAVGMAAWKRREQEAGRDLPAIRRQPGNRNRGRGVSKNAGVREHVSE